MFLFKQFLCIYMYICISYARYFISIYTKYNICVYTYQIYINFQHSNANLSMCSTKNTEPQNRKGGEMITIIITDIHFRCRCCFWFLCVSPYKYSDFEFIFMLRIPHMRNAQPPSHACTTFTQLSERISIGFVAATLLHTIHLSLMYLVTVVESGLLIIYNIKMRASSKVPTNQPKKGA